MSDHCSYCGGNHWRPDCPYIEATVKAENRRMGIGEIKTLDAKWLDPECHDGCISLKLKSQLAALELENEKLAELAVGAKSFAQHHHSCSSLFGFGPRPCTCGLTALRTEIERVKGGK